LGTFYHAKAQAVGAAESLLTFLSADAESQGEGTQPWPTEAEGAIALEAIDLIIRSPDGKTLAGPLNFTLPAGKRVALVGLSGAGKSSLLNALLGFLPYQGSLKANDIELQQIARADWRQQLSWVGQNPHLPEQSLRANILLGWPDAGEAQLQSAIERAYVSEFLPLLPAGLDTELGDSAARLSVGQAQRVAVARALLSPCHLLLLDEPTASLDAHSEKRVMQALNDASLSQTTLLVTHQLEDTQHYDEVWVMDKGRLIEQGSYQQLASGNGAFSRLLAQRSQEL
jgi:ATP-binding cassette subfamily C protein CydD